MANPDRDYWAPLWHGLAGHEVRSAAGGKNSVDLLLVVVHTLRVAANTEGNEHAWPIGGLIEWAGEAHRRSTGVELGEHEVVRATPWSTVIRWNANRNLVWGKAVCPGFAAECGLLPLLAERAPDHVLAPIEVDRKRGWLLLPDGGDTLKGTADVATWNQALLGYAELQQSMVGTEEAMLRVGCPDMRPFAAADRLEQMMEDGSVPFHRWLLDAARNTASLIDLDLIPATIQHDDLRPDNVFADGRVFDWGDTSLAHPFASLLTALMPNRPDRPGTALEKAAMRDSYLTSWASFITDDADALSPGTLREQASLAMLLAPIGRINAWLRAPAVALEIYPNSVDRWVEHMRTSRWP